MATLYNQEIILVVAFALELIQILMSCYGCRLAQMENKKAQLTQ